MHEGRRVTHTGYLGQLGARPAFRHPLRGLTGEQIGFTAAHQQDRRAYRIRVLPSGAAQYETCRAVATALQAEVLGVLDAGDREVFLGQLTRVADACRAAADASPRTSRGA